jgi:hypothetical protein
MYGVMDSHVGIITHSYAALRVVRSLGSRQKEGKRGPLANFVAGLYQGAFVSAPNRRVRHHALKVLWLPSFRHDGEAATPPLYRKRKTGPH